MKGRDEASGLKRQLQSQHRGSEYSMRTEAGPIVRNVLKGRFAVVVSKMRVSRLAREPQPQHRLAVSSERTQDLIRCVGKV